MADEMIDLMRVEGLVVELSSFFGRETSLLERWAFLVTWSKLQDSKIISKKNRNRNLFWKYGKQNKHTSDMFLKNILKLDFSESKTNKAWTQQRGKE